MNLKRRNFSSMFLNGLNYRGAKNKPGNSLALIIKQQSSQNKKKLTQFLSPETQEIVEEKDSLIGAEKKKDSGIVEVTISHEEMLEKPEKESDLSSILSKDRVFPVEPAFFRQQMKESEANLIILKQPPIPS